MAMVFFKMYSEILEDQKVQELSGDLFKFWVNLLALANRQKSRGMIPKAEEVAFCLRLSADATTANLEHLVILGLLDETPDGLTPHNWADRQRKADLTAAERAKRCRERKKIVTRDVTPASRVTSHLRHATVTRDVTPPSHPRHGTVTLASRPDKDKDNTPYISPTNDDKKTAATSKPAPPQGELAFHRIESQPSRSPEDLADVRAAEALLASDLRTEPLAQRLAREHNLAGNLPVAGWKWLRAAEKMVGPTVTDSQRKQFNYFATIAANTTDDERSRPQRHGSSKPEPEKPTVYYRARRRTPEELARAYSGMGSIAS